jgi:predicted nucleic acid-binding protein
MSAPDFIDTNILIYAYETDDARKQQIAQTLVEGALAGKSVVSAQVLIEFAATLLHKRPRDFPAHRVLTILGALSPVQVVAPNMELVQRAVEAHATYGIHFYDGLIVASAERAGCERIWSEDLNPGQKYFGVTVANPFQ